jgi:two-component system, response regulator PdtaR
MTTMTKGKVLVVDDDRLVLATVAHGLAQAGYQVIDADNGDDAILLARQHKPDLALLDIRMEGKTGFDVAEYLREYCQIPFMFLSAFADEATLKQVHALGAMTYLTKPLDIQQIIPEVDKAFATLKQRRSLLTSSDSDNAAIAPSADHDASSNAEKHDANLSSQPATVLLAIGIVMHRHSLTQQQALARLQAQATMKTDDLMAVCQRIVHAQEVMAGLGPL